MSSLGVVCRASSGILNRQEADNPDAFGSRAVRQARTSRPDRKYKSVASFMTNLIHSLLPSHLTLLSHFFRLSMEFIHASTKVWTLIDVPLDVPWCSKCVLCLEKQNHFGIREEATIMNKQKTARDVTAGRGEQKISTQRAQSETKNKWKRVMTAWLTVIRFSLGQGHFYKTHSWRRSRTRLKHGARDSSSGALFTLHSVLVLSFLLAANGSAALH